MTFRIRLAATAKADIRATTLWLREKSSKVVADRWLASLQKTINTLATRPERCPLAAESHKFPEELRELLHGRGQVKYRILFSIRDDTVYVSYVRHSSRDEIEP